ncbi:MAG: trehalose-6-phosphate synthase [Phycisphaerae bacterium]|nr:trehalose-6-phosphate synthase [Phycisphaerae bacterium]
MSKPRRLIVVSNRLPITRIGSGAGSRWLTSAGGLVTAMVPILKRRGGCWVGWPGGTGRSQRTIDHEGIRLHSVRLSQADMAGFYHGLSNRTLWPLFHDAIRTPEFRREWWKPYVEVNERFARATARAYRPGDTVWIHDYHLMLVPAMLRAMKPRARIGFFLHIPFPPEELFSWIPWRDELLEGLLGADVVGFQTHGAAQNFSRAARRHTDAEGTDSELEGQGRSITVREFPISIDFDWFDERARMPESIAEAEEIRRLVGRERKILLAVDRLDYTKGIDHRLEAYELLLRSGAVNVRECVLIQIAAPSREPVREYAEMRTRIDRMMGSLNGEFSEPGRVAVHYFRRTLSREEVVAYYRAADVMVVTPLRDGMNLVAKEYCASRSDTTGVLVLSEFAGAASQLRQALLVNPRDTEGMAEAMLAALKMKKGDAKFRMAVLRSMVRRHDVHEWADSFLEALAA